MREGGRVGGREGGREEGGGRERSAHPCVQLTNLVACNFVSSLPFHWTLVFCKEEVEE